MPEKRADQVPENRTITQNSESDNTRGYGHYDRDNPENEVGLIKYQISKYQNLYSYDNMYGIN